MSSIFHDIQGSAIFAVSAAIALPIFLYVLFFSSQYEFPPKAPKLVDEGWPIIGALRFFTARWEFFQHARSHSPSGNFSFRIGKYPLIGLTGEKGREVFFENRDLGFAEGYAVLFGQSPNSLQEGKGVQERDKEFSGSGGYFQRRITRMLKTENFGKSLPRLMEDVQTNLRALEKDPSGITDPFQSIFRIVYQLTMRIVGCDDIADDPALLEKTLGLYQTVEKSATATAIMFPRFPSLAVIKRTIAGGRLYMIFNRIVAERKKTGKRGDDPLQYLIDQGDSMERIIEFVIGSLFAGLLNSGINAAYVLVYLANNPEWQAKAREEVKSAAQKYSTNKDAPLVEQLSQLPIEAWESAFPFVELCLRDSIRLQLQGTAFRKNITDKDIPTGVNGEVIPPGAFVTYHTGDVHLDPTIYKDPEKWDPSRYFPDRAEDKKKPLSYIGWGVGRHPCLGMRFAKLEQNIILAFFLAMFDYQMTDKEGNLLQKLPHMDFNAHSAKRPDSPVYLKYTSRK